MGIINAVHVGNAPTLLSLKQLQKTAPAWMNTSMDIFNDPEANKVCPQCWLCTCDKAALELIQFIDLGIMYNRTGGRHCSLYNILNLDGKAVAL